MFFLLRSALCITAVVLVLPDRTLPSGHALVRSGVEATRDLCRADPRRCASVLKDGIATVFARGAAASTDALRPDDFGHGWVGPGRSTGS